MNTSEISVVIPNYNGRHLIEKNLPSLIDSLRDSGFRYEIIIVDDCSKDDSVSFLQNNYPEIRILNNEKNSGFSKTCNRGIFAAKNDIICLANSDVTFHKQYFSRIFLNYSDGLEKAVIGKIINYQNTFDNVVNSDDYFQFYFKRGLFRYRPVENSSDTTMAKNVFAPLGCCFVCTKKIFTELGGFNEIYSPFYWEDTDLSFRLQEKGFSIDFDGNAAVYHQASSTINLSSKRKFVKFISTRNKLLFFWLNIKGKEKWAVHVFFMLFSILTRWLILDFNFYKSFAGALFRLWQWKKD